MKPSRFANTPIIAYISLAEENVKERGTQAQIDAFCRKGVSVHALLNFIERVASVRLPDRGSMAPLSARLDPFKD